MSRVPILVDPQPEATVIYLNRAERHNALVPELLDPLLRVIEGLHDDPPPALILAAKSPSFSTGGDVRGFYDHRHELADYANGLVGRLNEILLSLMRFPTPVICAVHGRVCGGALGLVLASDLVVMAPAVTVRPWYPVVGFAPDGGWTALLPDRIGPARARRTLLTNDPITAQQALDWGLADALAEDVLDTARSQARDLAELVPSSLTSARRLLTDTDRIARALESERQAFVRQIQTPEALAGMQRFLGGTRS